MKKVIYLLLLTIILTSCDGVLHLRYVLKNNTEDTLTVKIQNIHPFMIDEIDTLNILLSGKELIVGMEEGIGLGWDTKSILYDKHPFTDSIEVFQHNKKVNILYNKESWKYSSKRSIYTHEKKETEPVKTSISQVGGKYIIDTSLILRNSNLTSLIQELESKQLKSENTYSEMPQIIQIFLDSLTGKFDIADPGEKWLVGCTRMIVETKINDTIAEVILDESSLPSRVLVYLGTSENIVLITYYTGGVGKSAHTLIIKYQDDNIIDLWKGNGPYDTQDKTTIIEFLKKEENSSYQNLFYL